MNSTQFAVICIFTGLVAVAVLVQGIALLIIASRVKALSARLDATSAKLSKQLDRIVPQLEEFIPVFKGVAEKVHTMSENLAGISAVAHERALKVDAFVDEATNTVRLQVVRLQDVLDTALQKIDETVTLLQSAVSTPINEVQALMRGIRTGVDVLFGRRRLNTRSHEDEEMFI